MAPRDRDGLVGIALLLPLLGLLALLVLWPLARGFELSLTDAQLLSNRPPAPVGAANYGRFFGDTHNWRYVLNTLIWCVGKVAGQLVLGLLLALLLRRPMPLVWLWRAVVLVPWAMPVVVSSLAWRWILDGQYGVLNRTLVGLGLLQQPVAWLVDPATMWPTVIAVHSWQFFPIVYASFLAGLQSIPPELYEAARIDGAGGWASLRHLTLPLLRPFAAVNALLGLILGLGDFSAIWTLTRGGPGGLTLTLAPLVYQTTFQFADLGYGSALAVVLFLATGALTAVYVRRVRLELG